MSRLKVSSRICFATVLLVALAALVWAFQGKPKLFVNGVAASSDVFVRNNVVYAPIRDMAKAMDMVVVKRPDGFEIKRAGGANPIEGIRGKVGDTLFDGNFQFKVIEVVRGALYKKRFDPSGGEVTTPYENEEILAVICRIKNATKKTVAMLFPGGQNTNVTDMEEHSFMPESGSNVDLRSRGENMLPGSAVDFALTFRIAKTAVLKDLVYQIQHAENLKQTDFRVSLKQD
jgi:hypothetical protein